jgi:hypothetical protein
MYIWKERSSCSRRLANPDAGITAGAIHLISEEAEAGFYMTLTVHAGEINVRALKEAKLGMDSNYIVTGPITVISTGDLTTSLKKKC